MKYSFTYFPVKVVPFEFTPDELAKVLNDKIPPNIEADFTLVSDGIYISKMPFQEATITSNCRQGGGDTALDRLTSHQLN